MQANNKPTTDPLPQITQAEQGLLDKYGFILPVAASAAGRFATSIVVKTGQKAFLENIVYPQLSPNKDVKINEDTNMSKPFNEDNITGTDLEVLNNSFQFIDK
jgi:hypothetical protein